MLEMLKKRVCKAYTLVIGCNASEIGATHDLVRKAIGRLYIANMITESEYNAICEYELDLYIKNL